MTAREDTEGCFGREYPSSEAIRVHETGAVEPNLGIIAKVSSSIVVLRLV